LLVPGTFSNSTFWFGTRGVGFARTLVDAGYYACALDPRGHGESARPRRDQHWDIDDWARLDVPAALEAVATPDNPAFIIGHSAGGAVALAALSADADLHAGVRGVVAIGTPLPWLQPWRGIGAWLIRASSLLLRHFPARVLRIGPEDELPRVMSQWMTWNIEGHWTGDDGTDYMAGLSRFRFPFLAIAGTGDRVFAPPAACRGLFDLIGSANKRFVLFGKSEGHAEDFDHVGLVVSKAARVEIWPRIVEWLESH
jgi:pimeloyl-ACP methyl ester carboxylesterase